MDGSEIAELIALVESRRLPDDPGLRLKVAAGDSRLLRSVIVGRPLSPRQVDVLRLVCEGLSNPEIAARLGIGVESVKTHVSDALLKLGCRSRTEAAAHVARMV